ncbi:MAG: hypothetical protein ACYDAK_05340 [Candidatus Limnocylindrales bacterium]
MSEQVFALAQIGAQAGSFTAPGAAVPATFLLPLTGKVNPDLNRASAYPDLDRGRNTRNLAGTGYYGVREAKDTLTLEARYEDIARILEQHWAGGVAPTGVGPYTRVYPFEAVAPTIKPATWELANIDAPQAQFRLISLLVDQMTLGFAAVAAGQASPWTVSLNVLAIDRDINPYTASLSPLGTPETIQGFLSRFYEGPVATAYAALPELAGSLKRFSITSQRHLVLRAYGSASDKATAFGFTAHSQVSFDLQVAVSATAKTDLHDTWNAASPVALGERRIRIQANGTGSKQFTVDGLAGIFAVPADEDNGERVYKVTGEYADDTTLSAPCQITIVNNQAT